MNASWRLDPRAQTGEHLVQILQKQGKAEDAAAILQMSLSLEPKSETLRARVNALPQPKLKKMSLQGTPSDQLNALRTIPVPRLRRDSGSAEYLLLFSAGKVVDSRLLGGEVSGPEVDAALRESSYEVAPPGDDTKIIRKGVLSCSKYRSHNARSSWSRYKQRFSNGDEQPEESTPTADDLCGHGDGRSAS